MMMFVLCLIKGFGVLATVKQALVMSGASRQIGLGIQG
jgi:hypothetical protein